jgi:phage tail-like protein
MSDTGWYREGPVTSTFEVKVDGQVIGRFIEVSGLSVEVAVEPVEEGGQNGFVHKLPGRMEWPNIVLKRGLTESDNLFAWIKKVSGDGFTGEQNRLSRSTAAITMKSSTGRALRAWNIEGAFPIKWTGPSFASGSDDPPEEELEIAHHGFTAVRPS